jgi:hypothetical protein
MLSTVRAQKCVSPAASCETTELQHPVAQVKKPGLQEYEHASALQAGTPWVGAAEQLWQLFPQWPTSSVTQVPEQFA